MDVNDVMHRKRSWRILGFWKGQSGVETCLGRRRLAFVCSPKPVQWPLWQVPHEMGGSWKSQNRKNVYLSPYVEEPLNSKVIKSFVPEQRSRYVFFEFRDYYVLSLWTFDVRFTRSHMMAMVHHCSHHIWTTYRKACLLFYVYRQHLVSFEKMQQ